jgi:ribonucleoside-diphosphate reductase alpha chain
MALPPTKSTSIILGGISEGIQPVYANVFEQDTAGGTVYRINPVLLDIMKERGMYTEETMKRIAEDQGSVQGEDWLDEHEKKVFRTAFEVSQEAILLMAGHRQKEVDQGQSVNVFFTADESEEEIARIHHIGFENEDVHSMYYLQSQNKAMKHKTDKEECLACHA